MVRVGSAIFGEPSPDGEGVTGGPTEGGDEE
jgi:hypothetical protein